MTVKRKTGIQSKLFHAFFIVVLISLLATNLIIYFFVHRTYSEQLLNNHRQILENITTQLDNSLNSIESFSRYVCLDMNLQKLMREYDKKEGYAYYKSIREINEALVKYIALKPDLIGDIYIIDRNGYVISRNAQYHDVPESDWYQAFVEKGLNYGFSNVREVSDGQQENHPNISYIASMFDLNNLNNEQSFMGHIIFNLNYNNLTSLFRMFENTQFTLLDQNSSLLWTNYSEQEFGSRIFDEDEHFYRSFGEYYFTSDIPCTGWNLILTTNVSSINRQLIQIALMFVVLVVLCLAVAGRVIILLSNNITRPLKELTIGLQKFSTGDKQIKLSIISGDEIEEIADVFNLMVDSINRQMQELLCKEKEKRVSQLRFLTAQIKPHFIYNNLNCIIYLARCGKNEDIISFTRAFINLLQATINTHPLEEISLLKEIEHMKYYLTIMQYRYENDLESVWNIQQNDYQMEIPSMVLEPLVENSVFHGILPKGTSGRITLTATHQAGKVRIEVEDNGCGINKVRLKQLEEELQSGVDNNDKYQHIGLINVNSRLVMCHGEDSRLHIESTEGQGTRVWFLIPEI